MRTLTVTAALRAVLLAAPLALAPAAAIAAGGHSSSKSSNGKAGNRYQATWTLADPIADAHAEDEAEDAHGADKAETKEAGGHDAPAEVDDSPRLVDLPIIVAPVIVDGELFNYAFVSTRLTIADGHDPWEVREQIAYLRDAMLRDAHTYPVNVPDHSGEIDPESAKRVWTASADRVLGAGVVENVEVLASDIRYPDLVGDY